MLGGYQVIDFNNHPHEINLGELCTVSLISSLSYNI